jgi:predicted MFS family arabinose efflux permease
MKTFYAALICHDSMLLRFGRKVMVKWCLLLVAISGTCTAFASSFFIYCSLRFLAGFSSMVILANSRMLGKSTILIFVFYVLDLTMKNHFI